jgi:hypothetical protein
MKRCSNESILSTAIVAENADDIRFIISQLGAGGHILKLFLPSSKLDQT